MFTASPRVRIQIWARRAPSDASCHISCGDLHARFLVEGALTDQTSVLRFIEDNWLGGERIGHGPFDTLAGSLDGMFDWRRPRFTRLILNPRTGEPVLH